MVLGVFVNLVDIAEVGVICLLQYGRDQEEGITLVIQHLLRDVFSLSGILDAEVVDRGNVAFFRLNRLRVDECPGGVGIVVYRKLLLLSILGKDKGGLKLGLLGSLWYLHPFLNVGSDMVWSEVEEWQTP